ncbi:MAG TPA: DNA repair protein RadC [Nitrospirales bacterium]|nr:DNA repair protein RadC [Nitrospirales bacterium]
MGIATWPLEERPRERLLRYGPETLTDGQLLAILLGNGHARGTALDISMALLNRHGGLQGLGQDGIRELCSVRGIGPAKAAVIKAALEIGKRATSVPLTTGQRVTSSRDVFGYYRPLLRDLRREVFKVILLDGKNTIIKDVTVSEGSLTLSIVHPREAFVPAVRESAAAVIFVHNHPSGDPEASPEDRALTQRLVSAGEIMGIRVLDHVIIGDIRYFSFADQGWLMPQP